MIRAIDSDEALDYLRVRKQKGVSKLRIKHQNDDPPPAFNMKVTGVFGNDALLRQVSEANHINQASDAGFCMNFRAEYNHQAISRLTLRDD